MKKPGFIRFQERHLTSVVQPLLEQRAVRGMGRPVDNRPPTPIMDDKTSLGRGLMLTGVTEAVTEMKESSEVLVVPPAPGAGCFRQLPRPRKGSATAPGSDLTGRSFLMRH